jgi:hypothetical protein
MIPYNQKQALVREDRWDRRDYAKGMGSGPMLLYQFEHLSKATICAPLQSPREDASPAIESIWIQSAELIDQIWHGHMQKNATITNDLTRAEIGNVGVKSQVFWGF